MDNNSDKKRIEKLIEIVMAVARGDFSVQAELAETNDDLDALAMGINMMIDDLRNNADLELQNKKIKAINEELEKAKEKAQRSDKLKTAFLANMSHELRSPMNAILGFSSLLSRTESAKKEFGDYYRYIDKAGKQLLALINDIIDIAKIESNELHVYKEEHKLKNRLEQIYEIMNQDKRILEKPDLKLVYEWQKVSEKIILDTDEVRFKQIFFNLISNAIKYTEKGYVELDFNISKDSKDIVELYVKDTGIGIPKEMHEVIFDRFTQAHSDRLQLGTGLGLSITKGLVDLLDGYIKVDSEVGKGSLFTVSFPIRYIEGIVEKRDKTITNENIEDLSQYTIYIAEDLIESYVLLEQMLKKYGCKIKRAENGSELLDMVKDHEPDLILLDIHMPVLNGYETIKELRRRNFKKPVIAQTAYAMADERINILGHGCDDYITKPIDIDELLKMIKKHLKN